jgi:hypothetical protein
LTIEADWTLPGTFYLSRFDGIVVDQEEAAACLTKYETSGQTWFATPQEMRQYGISGGVFIEFEMYDAGHSLQSVRIPAAVLNLSTSS